MSRPDDVLAHPFLPCDPRLPRAVDDVFTLADHRNGEAPRRYPADEHVATAQEVGFLVSTGSVVGPVWASAGLRGSARHLGLCFAALTGDVNLPLAVVGPRHCRNALVDSLTETAREVARELLHLVPLARLPR